MLRFFPHGNANPLAHRLLSRNKIIPTTLEAPVEDLIAIKEIGQTASMKLHGLLGVFNRYTTEKMIKNSSHTTIGEIYDYKEIQLIITPSKFTLNKKKHNCVKIYLGRTLEVFFHV